MSTVLEPPTQQLETLQRSTVGGNVRMIYSELVEPHALGAPIIERGSHVEPDQNGLWWADLSPCNGPRLGPYTIRSRAIEAEIAWLKQYWLEPAVA